MNASDRTVADPHSFITSNLGEVGVSGQLGSPGRFSRKSPKRIEHWVGPPHLVWIHSRTEKPLDQPRTKPRTLTYQARSSANTRPTVCHSLNECTSKHDAISCNTALSALEAAGAQ